MSPSSIVSGALPELEDALAEAVAAARADDPLAPVTVVAGQVLLPRYLPRMLAARGIAQMNVHYVRPHELAQRLAGNAHPAAPRLSPGAERLLVREVAARARGYFAGIANREGFAEALGRLFRDLELGGFDATGAERAVEAVAHQPDANAAKLGELARLYGAYLKRTAHVARAADDYRSADPARLEGPLLVYGVWSQVRELELRLFERVARANAEITFFVPASGGAADEALQPFLHRLALLATERRALPAAAHPAPAVRLASRLFEPPDAAHTIDAHDAIALASAPDTVREVWEAARACLRWARDGIGFHEMAVAYRNREPYRALVDEIFSEARIDTYLHDGRLLASHPLGRRLLALLDLAAGGAMPRAKVMEFLTETRVSRELRGRYEHFRPSEWETYTREAGIVDGPGQWQERLERLAGEKRENAKLENFEWQAAVADRIDVLRAFIGDFHAALTARPEEATWEEHLAYLRGIASQYAAGTEPLLDALDDLKTIEAVTPRASFAVFCRAVRDDLESRDATLVLNEPVREFGRRGVAVIDASSLRHLRFRAVHLLGVAERAWPPPSRPDPLLLEHERRALSATGEGVLPLRTEPDDEPLTFWLAVQAARERLGMSYARAAAGGSGKHLPSYFFRSAGEALEGARLPLDRIEGSSYVRRYNAGRLWSDDLGESLSPAEYDRGLVRAALERGERAPVAALERETPPFGDAIRAREQRWSRGLTPYDGVMESAEALRMAAAKSDFSRGVPVSPSRMETYATCPYRYYLRYALRIEPVEEPERIERIDALERGSLIHAILERFLRDIGRDDPPRPERRDAHLARLMEVARDEERDRERRGVTGRSLIWEMDRKQIEEDLVRWYDAEIKDDAGVTPGAFEVSFGPVRYGLGSQDETYSSERPLVLRVQGRDLAFQGRIDRVDWDEGRAAFRVIDYKTGRPGDKAAFDRGKALQLPIYLHAAAQALGMRPEQGEAQYFYVSSRGGFKRKTITGAELADRREEFEQVLGTIADGIDAGMFSPNPGKTACMWCDYAGVCDTRIDIIMQRKADDPRAAAYRAMGEIP